MIWQVVVVFDGFEGGGLAKESEVVDGVGGGEDRLDRFQHAEAAAEDGYDGYAGGGDGAGGVFVVEVGFGLRRGSVSRAMGRRGKKTNGRTLGDGQSRGGGLTSYDQSDFVNEGFGFAGIGGVRSELGELGLETWVGGNVDVGWKR